MTKTIAIANLKPARTLQRGDEQLTSSSGEALCWWPFPQVAAERNGDVYQY
ncbi:MAG: hypothetical protein M3285_14130 [Actinomycetota bacterium]|nr:hypothetical protein [Actinomycetota bacterium]